MTTLYPYGHSGVGCPNEHEHATDEEKASAELCELKLCKACNLFLLVEMHVEQQKAA